ncbi:MAG: 3-hydroxyacyl-CoA dehydrogenase family protein [Chlamydiota bacterium]
MTNLNLDHVAVIGAGGKMGSGISLLLVQEVALQAEEQNRCPTITLIDSNEKSLFPLKQYLRGQITKFAEKNVITLREVYRDDQQLVSNEEMIHHFVNRALEYTNFSTSLESAKSANIIFEAIVEDASVKTELYKFLKDQCSHHTFFLTNTSSIPISYLNAEANLNNRIIGYHFYNPPAVQKLLEIIPPDNVDTNLLTFSQDLGKRLKKTIVYSRDVAGFIGNGHFIPEGLYACKQVDHLTSHHSLHEAVYMLNKVTEEYLIRPMGIFQLIDYVGIDVFQNITKTMRQHLKDESFDHPLINAMVENGVLGGQNPDGSQKDGFFQYSGTKIIGYYDFEKKEYIPAENAQWRKSCDEKLGTLPKEHLPWKKMLKESKREERIEQYFQHLFVGTTMGQTLARDYLNQSVEIALSLVNANVAKSLSDVSTVLKTGFFHLYGPEVSWIKHNESVGSSK